MINLPNNNEPQGAEFLARLAVKTARETCQKAGINFEQHVSMLTALVIEEVKIAVREIAEDKCKGGPEAVLMLAEPRFLRIYFADAGSRGALRLIDSLNTNPTVAQSEVGAGLNQAVLQPIFH
jgi:hypothetical protein